MGTSWRLSNRRLGILLGVLVICEIFLLVAFWSVKGLLDRNVPVHESTIVTVAAIILVPTLALLFLSIGRYAWRRRFTVRQMFLLLVLMAVVLGSGRVLFKAVVGHYVVRQLGRGRLTDFDMLLMGDELSDRTSLRLYGKQITDTGFARLAPSPQLHTLDLYSTSVSDAALAHLRRFTNLRALYLDGNNITDAGTRGSPGVTVSPYGCDVTPHDCSYIASARFLVINEFDLGCFDHCVGRLHHGRKTTAFDHS